MPKKKKAAVVVKQVPTHTRQDVEDAVNAALSAERTQKIERATLEEQAELIPLIGKTLLRLTYEPEYQRFVATVAEEKKKGKRTEKSINIPERKMTRELQVYGERFFGGVAQLVGAIGFTRKEG